MGPVLGRQQDHVKAQIEAGERRIALQENLQ